MNNWKGMIPDKFFNVNSTTEKEAELSIVKELRGVFGRMTDEELVDELAIIVWEDN